MLIPTVSVNASAPTACSPVEAAMEKDALVAAVNPLLVACRVYWPGAERFRSLNVAIPLMALRVKVPLNDPAAEPEPKLRVTELVAVPTKVPL
jgi:hypothetical protein